MIIRTDAIDIEEENGAMSPPKLKVGASNINGMAVCIIGCRRPASHLRT